MSPTSHAGKINLAKRVYTLILSRVVVETGRIQWVKIGLEPVRLKGNRSFCKNLDFRTNLG
ncbi:MAG: hypothetical protein LBU76_11590, partial [Azoarcus sp.]|nr:hypothetical protein [Azoarcus sp.]